jgi:CheY-like chemotaxis protein
MKMVSGILKCVDDLVRKNEFDQAELVLSQAKKIDPKNIYAHAFGERIAILKGLVQVNTPVVHMFDLRTTAPRGEAPTPQIADVKSQGLHQSPPASNPSVRLQAEMQTRKRTEEKEALVEIRKTVEADLAKKEHEHILDATAASRGEGEQCRIQVSKKEEAEYSRKVQRIITEAFKSKLRKGEKLQPAIAAKESEESCQREQMKIATEEARQAKDSLAISRAAPRVPPSTCSKNTTISSKPEEKKQPIRFDRQEALSQYKLALASVWTAGAATTEEADTLNKLRMSLSISNEEHKRIEKEVRYETYIQALKKASNSGKIAPENATVVAALRDRFHISIEEHLTIRAKLLSEIQPIKKRPSLLIIDDDETLLGLITRSLNEAGFVTTSVTTSDEAYVVLKNASPDLVLCDVHLKTSTMGGFAFYEKVREMESLRQTPFIFLSGLADEALIRTAKALGADDYLSKPISEETLISAIRGKIRRYREVKGRRN